MAEIRVPTLGESVSEATIGRWFKKPGDIVMLSSDHCVYCEAARRWLVKHHVSFEECFIERDAACAESYRAQGARGTPTFGSIT